MPALNTSRNASVPLLSPASLFINTRAARRAQATAACFFLLCSTLCICQPPTRSVLCQDGNANFSATFRTGVAVHIGATHRGDGTTLATRSCAANLTWEKGELAVAADASQVDLDAFGADLGDGVPVAAFQIKKTDADCCMEYRIYSLEKPPRLLRTIQGGEFFSASDMDLDGSIEIWTHDAAAVDGFEKLSLSKLSAPTVVFRWAHGQLRDASAEFQPYFDREIAKTRAEIPLRDLENFKNSDGKLASSPPPESADELHRLRMAKIKVLEIVWAYLYSGRDQEAWRSLAEMWPREDTHRIRVALMNAREMGAHGQADVTSAGPMREKRKHAHIFDAVSRSETTHKLEVVPPQAILLERPPVPESQQGTPETDVLLDLVIDAAGKVRSVELSGKGKVASPAWIESALTWKFIPALKGDRPVASRLRIAVSPKQ